MERTTATTTASQQHSYNRSTTVVVVVVEEGGLAMAAALCAVLGDGYNPRNRNHVFRLLVGDTSADSLSLLSRPWTCHEAFTSSSLVSPWPGSSGGGGLRWKTHRGAADAVLPMDKLERGILGMDTVDDGGVADAVLLCCSLEARGPLLSRVAHTLHRLDDQQQKVFVSSEALLLGVVGSWRGFDWQCRHVFASTKKSPSFVEWNRPIMLAGYNNLPKQARIIQDGVALLLPTMRSSDVQTVACCGSLKTEDSSTSYRESAAQHLQQILPFASAGIRKSGFSLSSWSSEPIKRFRFDSYSSSEYLLNSLSDADIIFHACLAHAIIDDSFSNLGRLIIDMLLEFHILVAKLTSNGVFATRQQTSELRLMESALGANACLVTGNTSEEVLQRLIVHHNSDKEQGLYYTRLLQYVATRRARAVLDLATLPSPVPSDEPWKITHKTNVLDFFLESLPCGLCLALGLGEIVVGMLDLTDSMPTTLKVARALQERKGKEYIVPCGSNGIVCRARDVGDTMAPQAFGIVTIPELWRFLQMSPFGENVQRSGEFRLQKSPVQKQKQASRL